jgi:hypothetical protein
MRLFATFILSAMFFAASALPGSAQNASARTPLGPATIEASQSENGIRLNIAVAGAEPQVFDGVGEALVPLRAGNRSGPILVLDIDRDGIDEIFVRTSVRERGLLLVFRWDATTNGYAPVNFTEDTGAPKQYLLVHLSQPVTVNGNVVEANHDSNEGGRKRLRVFRYRWDGTGFAQSTDH